MERKYEDSSSLIQVSFRTMTLHIFLEYSPGKPIFVCGVGKSASKKWPQVVQGPPAELQGSCRVPWTLITNCHQVAEQNRFSEFRILQLS